MLCGTTRKLFFTSWVDNVDMTVIGPVPSGLSGNQLLGNRSIFDLENRLLAPPPSPLRGICNPWNTDTKFTQLLGPKILKHNGHYVSSIGSLLQYVCYCFLLWYFLNDITVIIFPRGNSVSDKSLFLCFFLQSEWSQTSGRGRQYTSLPF